MVLADINMTGTGTILLLTSVLAFLVDCISPCHILKAKHCSLSLNAGGALTHFRLPTCPHFLPHPSPTHPAPIDSICELKKPSQKPAALKLLIELAIK